MDNFSAIPCPYCGHKPNVERSGQNLKINCNNPGCEMHPTTRWRSTAKYGEQRVFDIWNTLAGRTCVMKSIKNGAMYDVFQCTNCGTEFAERNTEDYIDYKYCPNCGAKVVE